MLPPLRPPPLLPPPLHPLPLLPPPLRSRHQGPQRRLGTHRGTRRELKNRARSDETDVAAGDDALISGRRGHFKGIGRRLEEPEDGVEVHEAHGGSSRSRKRRQVEGDAEEQYRKLNESPLSEQSSSLAAFWNMPLLEERPQRKETIHS